VPIFFLPFLFAYVKKSSTFVSKIGGAKKQFYLQKTLLYFFI